MVANDVPFRGGHLRLGAVMHTGPLLVRPEGGKNWHPVDRVWGTPAPTAGDPVLLHDLDDGSAFEVWTLRYAADVRAGRVEHPLRPAGNKVWGRETWPHAVLIRCDSCRSTHRPLLTMHGDEQLRDLTTPTSGRSVLDAAAGLKLSIAEIDRMERPGAKTYVYRDRDEACRIQAHLDQLQEAGDLDPQTRVTDADSARSEQERSRQVRVTISCHPRRCTVRRVPLRRDTLEQAYVWAVAERLSEISLRDLRQIRKIVGRSDR